MATPGMQGEVSPESTGKNSLFSRREPARREAGLPRTTGNTTDQNQLKPCTGKPFELSNKLELESQKGNPD
jgi:hypothetical protein